jgi:ribosomal-protein-alanine N-acetyltransferase
MAANVIAAVIEMPVMTGTQSAPRPGMTAPLASPRLRPDWRGALPTLVGPGVTLRELQMSDAPALLATMNAEEVARFISTPPRSVGAFERFIQWTQRARAEGRYICFAVVPHGMSAPVGVFQVRQLGANFATAEWGFALGSAYWGKGYFVEAATLVLEFAFDTVGVERMEARSATPNGRGHGALRKMGAVWEGVLRRSFSKDGRQMDQMLWSILADEWRQSKRTWANGVLMH